MNIIVVSGNLGRPPRHTGAGTPQERLNFSIAVNEGRGDNRRTGWLDVTVFGPGCSNIAQNVEVGQELHIKGRLALSREELQTKPNEQGETYQRFGWNVIADQFEGVTFGRKKGEGAGGAASATTNASSAPAEEEVPF